MGYVLFVLCYIHYFINICKVECTDNLLSTSVQFAHSKLQICDVLCKYNNQIKIIKFLPIKGLVIAKLIDEQLNIDVNIRFGIRNLSTYQFHLNTLFMIPFIDHLNFNYSLNCKEVNIRSVECVIIYDYNFYIGITVYNSSYKFVNHGYHFKYVKLRSNPVWSNDFVKQIFECLTRTSLLKK